LRRVRALESSGLIEGYTAILNEQAAGLGVNVFVSITLERQERADLAAFEQAVRQVPEVMECYLMSGEYDYLLRVVVTDTSDFERVHSRHLTSLPHVARVQSSFALRTIQKSRALPIR
jgi:DNA-binding Lrp family transcriptional regulator